MTRTRLGRKLFMLGMLSTQLRKFKIDTIKGNAQDFLARGAFQLLSECARRSAGITGAKGMTSNTEKLCSISKI